MNLPVYVISLFDARDKRAALFNRLQSIGIHDWEVIDAIRGSSLSPNQREQLCNEQAVMRSAGRAISAGELGCALSHLACYQKLLSSSDEWALILEDDAEPGLNFKSVVDSLLVSCCLLSVDVVNLGPIRKFTKSFNHKMHGHELVYPVRVWHTHAYLINRRAAHSIMSINMPVAYMADDWSAFRRLGGLSLAGLDPFVCRQSMATINSGIEADRKLARRSFSRFSWARALYIFLRWSRRFHEVLSARGRRIHRH